MLLLRSHKVLDGGGAAYPFFGANFHHMMVLVLYQAATEESVYEQGISTHFFW
jgi:hypothetical protein